MTVTVEAIGTLERVVIALSKTINARAQHARLVELGWTSHDGTPLDWRHWQSQRRFPYRDGGALFYSNRAG